MGVEGNKKAIVPPLPAPTETESISLTPTELATDVSKADDDRSSYSLPEDGTPVTIKTRGHRSNKSQTSLLIEYFEGAGSSGSGDQRKPSVRVHLRPSNKSKGKSGGDRDRIQITETKIRKASLSRRSAGSGAVAHSELSALSGDMDDAKSIGSYASATEESNVSRNPIDIEIDRNANPRRQRAPASPLIPAADSSKLSYQPGTMSDISAIPTDSFLDGSGPTTSFKMSEGKRSRSRSPSRAGDVLAGAAAGLAVAAAADKIKSKSRGESRDRERVVLPKTRDKDKKHKSSKSRTSSISKEEKHSEGTRSPRRRSSKTQQESIISGADSSILSSGLSPSRRSGDQYSVRSGTSKASSINNPKLLETVEDAIRRLILPELNALKREASKHKDRRSSTSSATSMSKDEYASENIRSPGPERNAMTPRDSLKMKERRDREARHNFDDSPSQSALSHESVEEEHHIDDTPMRSTDHIKAAALGAAGVGAAALAAHEIMNSPSDQRTRRRRRAEMRSRGSDQIATEDYDQYEHTAPIAPPMPLMSEINPSEITRTSILSAETDRPHSASEELTPVHEVSRGMLSAESSPTPTRANATLQALGTQHANISHGDLNALPRSRASDIGQEYEVNEYGQKVPLRSRDDEYDEDEYEGSELSGQYDAPQYDFYNTQEVPPPLKYVPYQPERRGLSPIPSVSGYTDGEPPNRDSRVTHTTTGSLSSPEKSLHSPSSVPSNVVRDFGEDEYRDAFNEDSDLGVGPGQSVRAVGANPNIIHPSTIESNVASLVDGSMLEESVLTGESGLGGHAPYSAEESMVDEEQSRHYASPSKQSVGSHREYMDERGTTPTSGSHRSREFANEYEIDEYGRKVAQGSKYRQSPTASEAAVAGAAVSAAVRALRAQQQGKHGAPIVLDSPQESFSNDGIQRNRSFKERTMNGQRPGPEPKHSVDRFDEQPKLGFTSLPDANDPMPDYGAWNEDEDDLVTNPSLLEGKGRELEGDEVPNWQGETTPRGQTPLLEKSQHFDAHDSLQNTPTSQKKSGDANWGVPAAAGAAALAAGVALAAAAKQSHSRQPSQEHEDEWRRTSEDHKRDTLVTNPYEGASPIVNDNFISNAAGFDQVFGYGTRSPPKVDEGYISQGPNKTPDIQNVKGKGVEFDTQPNAAGVEDPFFSPTQARHLSGLSQGMASPLYDAATGTGIDRIESKDIIALMQHLTVRDAQRSARDTELLVTLVRAAAEMRNSFEDIKRLLADTEDVIITEVKENTEQSVLRAINGPRPYPGSAAARSVQGGGSQAGTVTGDDLPAKKRNLFRRALKGLSAKSTNDLGRIEDMLMQLLTEVDVLKAQTAPGAISPGNPDGQSYDLIQPEVQYEQDHGYEPEGNAGTSTASHASQSGHLSLPQSRGTSVKLGYDRKVSGHRISTVPEDNEEEYDHGQADETVHYSNPDMLMTPGQDQRGSSVPLATPPQPVAPPQASLSNDNTPRTEDGSKKHKSGSRTSWFPKISRWSETTTSSIAQTFRKSGQSRKDEEGGTVQFLSAPSRSGSIGSYSDNFQFSDPHAETTDKLHTGFSQQDLAHDDEYEDEMMEDELPEPIPLGRRYVAMTPEDPKYKAHRNSLNLQHPQPRAGQTERFKAALESQALGYDQPMTPRSGDWAGSATSLNRFPRNANRDSYGSAADQVQQQQYWTASPGAANITATAGPPRPPKEPLEMSMNSVPNPMTRGTPPKLRPNKLQKQSPLPHHSVESGYGTMTHGVPTASYISHSRDGGSPRLENRNLSGALGVPTRRPSGPRAMTPKSGGSGASEEGDRSDPRRKRDTFGTITSQDTDTF